MGKHLPYTAFEYDVAVAREAVDPERVHATVEMLERLQRRLDYSTLAEAASEQLHHVQLETTQRMLTLAVNALRRIALVESAPEGPHHAQAVSDAQAVLHAFHHGSAPKS